MFQYLTLALAACFIVIIPLLFVWHGISAYRYYVAGEWMDLAIALGWMIPLGLIIAQVSLSIWNAVHG